MKVILTHAKEPMSLVKSKGISLIGGGAMLVLTGVVNFFDGVIWSVAGMITAVISLLLVSIPMILKSEMEDERSKNNMFKAKASSLQACLIGVIVVGIIGILSHILNINIRINLVQAFGFVGGGILISVGYYFCRYEKAGE